jgi:uncharacterized membrane protein YbhN (UPF0104 family)
VSRLLLRALGVVLIGLVLYLVGWSDTVVTAGGVEHVGRVLSQDEQEVVVETEEGAVRLPASEVDDVRRGLRGPLRTLLERPGWVLAGAALHLAAIATVFLRWRLLLAGAGLVSPVATVMRLGWIGLFFSNVLPGGAVGGDVVRSVYAASAHPDGKTRAVLSVFMDRLVGLVALCLIAAAAVLAAPGGSNVALARTAVLVLLAGGAVAFALVYSVRLRKALGLAWVLDRLPFAGVVLELRQALAMYAGRPRIAVGAFLLALLSHVLALAAFYLYGGALGDPLTLLAVGVAIPVAQIVSAVPALPGGWGVGDAAYFFFLPAVGVPAGQALALSFLYRCLHTLLSLPGGLLLARARPQAAD